MRFMLLHRVDEGIELRPDQAAEVEARARRGRRAALGRWHPHELRHSEASLMLAQGTSLEGDKRPLPKGGRRNLQKGSPGSSGNAQIEVNGRSKSMVNRPCRWSIS